LPTFISGVSMRASAMIAHTLASTSDRFYRFVFVVLVLMSASVNVFAQITVSTSALTFANQAVGTTSAAKVVTIKNTGASAQAVVFVPSGPFTETDTCAGNIAAAHSCKMSV